MPELPEIETFKRYLDRTSLHQRITNVEVRDAYVLKGISARELASRLKGPSLRNSHRHGKHLFGHHRRCALAATAFRHDRLIHTLMTMK